MKSLLILKVGDALEPARAQGQDFERWIARGLGSSTAPIEVVDARTERVLPAPEDPAGIVITGSASMVTDRPPWSEALVPWLRSAVQNGTPLLGICYGHQLLAHALGGEVDYRAQGMEIGTVQVQKTRLAASDPLFAVLPDGFAAQVVHSQSVRRLPPGAVCLASSADESHQAYRIGTRAWGVQFHPEFGVEAMHDYVRKFAPALAQSGRAAEDIVASLRETPVAARVLEGFARIALGD